MAAIIAAEVVTIFVQPLVGIILHISIMMAVVMHAAWPLSFQLVTASLYFPWRSCPSSIAIRGYGP
jgi:hypothetical protein